MLELKIIITLMNEKEYEKKSTEFQDGLFRIMKIVKQKQYMDLNEEQEQSSYKTKRTYIS